MPSKAYFKDIKFEIINQLNSAIESIYIAVAWFTDDSLFSTLIKKAEVGVQINLIISHDEINLNKFGLPFIKLKAKGCKFVYHFIRVRTNA